MIWRLTHEELPIGYIEQYVEDNKFNSIWSDFRNWKGSHVEFYYKTFKESKNIK